MKKTCLLAAVCFALSTTYAVAEDDHPSENMHQKMDSSMPMHDKEKCDMMSKMKSEKMKQMMQKKQNHMQAVEKRLANIENLLQQLVDLQKQKSPEQAAQ